MVSPHFPPDTGAATHRVRLIAPHLEEFGWVPTVLTVDPRDYEGRIDVELEAIVPATLEIRRVRALSPRWTRLVGVGDLGLRALWSLHRACRELLRSGGFDVLFVTIFPTYPALLGPMAKRWAPVPFVLDYIDPWVGAWGHTTGPGPGGRPDFKSRLSRKLSEILEPLAVRAADGITAVSEQTFRAVQNRIPESREVPAIEIPYGGEAADFEHLRLHKRPNTVFDSADGNFHLVYVGTLLPLGVGTLRAFLGAVRLLRQRKPDVYAKVRIHFVGTSNQTTRGVHEAVTCEARIIGVQDVVHEIPGRLDYLDALNVLVRSSAILLIGSSEPHYTASKLYPAILAKRPVLAAYHEQSTVVNILRHSTHPPSVRLVTYGDDQPAESRVEAIYGELEAQIMNAVYDPRDIDPRLLEEYSARSMARRLAGLFDRVTDA
jgi:hypothetical protein